MHAFVDETKARGLIMAATVSHPRAAEASRKALNGLRMSGQRRIHFVRESDSRRRQICSVICNLDVKVRIYDASHMKDLRVGRAAALDAVVHDLARIEGDLRLVIEQDDSLVQADRRVLYRSVRAHGLDGRLVYTHARPQAEPMLWIFDAVVWGVAKGSPWRQRVSPIIDETITI